MSWNIEYLYSDVEQFILELPPGLSAKYFRLTDLKLRTMNHVELKEKVLANPEASAEYENLEAEFSLLRQMLKARERAGLSQAEVAERRVQKRQQ